MTLERFLLGAVKAHLLRGSSAPVVWRPLEPAAGAGRMPIAEIRRDAANQPQVETQFMSYRILLVDPDETAAAAAKQALVANGYRAAAVGTFAEATRQTSLDCPDLIVTALRLEAYNGLHLLLRCRADHPELPVIVMGRPEDFCSDIALHGAPFFAKPSDLALLVTMVSGLLVDRLPRDSNGEPVGSRKRTGQALDWTRAG